VQKAPDYERIQHTLRAGRDFLKSDELWVQKYLELADKVLKSEIQHSAPKQAFSA
jgi:hypothetical protein